jgi:peptide/nickel transport system permease protein
VAASPVTWLAAAAHLDLGQAADGTPVAAALAGAGAASLLILCPAWLLRFVCGWAGGLWLAGVLEGRPGGKAPGLTARWAGRAVDAAAVVAQALPVFWVGGLLVAAFAVGLGWLPPGGVAGADMPAFGTAAYGAALRAQPGVVLGDLLAHLALPVATLALAGLAVDLRLMHSTVAAGLAAPYTHVARGAGLTPRRLLHRAVRPGVPGLAGAVASDLPLMAGSLILVEYLFGWPGLGLLAYHAARAGDVATLGALLLAAGLAATALGTVADLVAGWADPRLRIGG